MFLVFFMCVCPEIGYIMVYRCFYRAYHNILKIAFYSGKRSFESLDLGTIRHRSCPWTKRHNIVRFFSTEPTAKCWENRKTQYASYDWDMGKHTGNHKSTTELFSWYSLKHDLSAKIGVSCFGLCWMSARCKLNNRRRSQALVACAEWMVSWRLLSLGSRIKCGPFLWSLWSKVLDSFSQQLMKCWTL
jgi:hypothetical protein